MTIESIKFNSESKGILSAEEVLEEIKIFIKHHPERFYKIIIGTDSHASNKSCLITALTVWRVGNGAIHFWVKSEEKEFATMRERIWQETMNSIMLAQEMRTRLKNSLGEEFFWDGNEIHVDVGQNGPTKELIESVTGVIKGYDFVPVIKPYSFGASVVADRHT